jgi:hypothetical protein
MYLQKNSDVLPQRLPVVPVRYQDVLQRDSVSLDAKDLAVKDVLHAVLLSS